MREIQREKMKRIRWKRSRAGQRRKEQEWEEDVEKGDDPARREYGAPGEQDVRGTWPD